MSLRTPRATSVQRNPRKFGFVSKVVAAALETAATIASKSSIAEVGTKHLLLHSRDHRSEVLDEVSTDRVYSIEGRVADHIECVFSMPAHVGWQSDAPQATGHAVHLLLCTLEGLSQFRCFMHQKMPLLEFVTGN